jgi:DHA1 family bicyclomycin/chloramphenicol resistance-like MFS transporter
LAGNVRLIAILALVASLGPITIHIIVPVLPEIARDFGAGGAVVQLTLSLGLIALAAGTLIHGSASDRFGRKPVLLGGLGLFFAGSLLCVWSPNVEILIAGRVVQSFGGAAGLVVSRAILRDLFPREQAARMMGYMLSVVVLAPMMAPLIGGYLTEFFGWHTVFLFAAGLATAALFIGVPLLPETVGGTRARSGGLIAEMRHAYPILLRTPQFLAYVIYAGCGMGMFLCYVGGMPYLMVTLFERPPSEIGLYLVSLSGSFMLGTFLSTRLTRFLGMDRTIRWASVFVFLFSLAVPGALLFGAVTPLAFFLPALGMGLFHGLAMPNAQAGAVSVKPSIAGSASGLMMFIQITIGSGFAQIAGVLPKTSPWPLAILIVVAAFGAFVAYNLLIGNGAPEESA